MSEILVITSLPDPHLEMVQNHLNAKIDVFDPSKFLEETEITYRFDSDGFCITSQGRNLSTYKSVWFRKPSYLKPNDFPVEKAFQQFSYDAYRKTVTSFYDLLNDKFWISDFRRILLGNNKLWQFNIARSLGFKIPKTLVSNNAEEVKKFRADKGDLVTKSLAFSPVQQGEAFYGFFTTLIGKNQDVNLSGLSLAPAMFQEAILHKKDLRVTVVGEQIFPCVAKPIGSVENSIDWREGIRTKEVEYAVFEDFDPTISTLCVACVKNMGLKYGAIDLALDENGTYWFLEINPNGQWAFVEHKTGLPISKALAKALSTGSID